MRCRLVPRYYFHLFNSETVLDEDGAEFANVDAALDQARTLARDMAAQSVRGGSLTLHHRIEIAGDGGEVVAKVHFRDVVEVRE